MLKWMKIFFVTAILMAILGFGQVIGPFSGISQLLTLVFAVAGVIAAIMHVLGHRKA